MADTQVRISEPKVWQWGVPHTELERLRHQNSLSWQQLPLADSRMLPPELHPHGYWAVTRYADVLEICKRPQDFPIVKGGAWSTSEPESIFGAFRSKNVESQSLAHGPVRRVLAATLSDVTAQKRQSRIDTAVTKIFKEAIQQPRGDFARVAERLPVAALCEFLDLQQDDLNRLERWRPHISRLIMGTPVPATVNNEIADFAMTLYHARKKHPGDDALSRIASLQIEEGPAPEELFIMVFMALLITGLDTVSSAIAGAAKSLCEHPEQRRLLLSNTSLIPSAIEELLRWTSPVIKYHRTASRDLLFGQCEILEGDALQLFFCSANRDADIFSAPNRFDIRRFPNPHLAFGWGRRACIGAGLATRQLTHVVQLLLEHVPEMEIDGPVEYTQCTKVNSVIHMPVRYR